jgi:tetratricopeptide (TPR) repeat protein
VLELDFQNEPAYYELGETYLKLKQLLDAFQSFDRVVSMNSDNLEAQLKIVILREFSKINPAFFLASWLFFARRQMIRLKKLATFRIF